MPLQKLQLRPGVNRESTSLANEGTWFEMDKVRFRSGFPEKLGGWTRDTGTYFNNGVSLPPETGSYWGVARSLFNWITLAGFNLMGVGTNLKYYIQQTAGGSFYDVTPLRKTSTGVANAFTTTNASTTVVVNDPGHGGSTGDFVTISGVVGSVNGIPAAALNREFRITYLTANTYSIVVSSPATSPGTAGTATLAYQIQTGGEVYTVGVGWGAGGWGGTLTVSASTTLTASLSAVPNTRLTAQVSATATTLTVDTTTGFAASGSLLVEDEIITYSGRTATTFTGCTRGTSGTTAVIHDALEGVTQYSTVTIAVVSTTGFAASGTVGIGGETITYSGVTPTSFTGCVRGYNSTPVAQSNGSVVNQYTGATGWGSPAPAGVGVGVQLRLWSQDNFGDYLVMNPRGGPIYLWVPAASPSTYNRAQVLSSTNTNTQDGNQYWLTDSSCPTVANIVATSDTSRFVIAFGCNDYGSAVLDPLLVRWSDQENYKVWAPAATNQAGSFRLSIGSSIVAELQARQEILIWTDAALYSMQYLGPPYVWGFNILADNVSIMGPNTTATAANITYWMGRDKFYMYSGRVETLYCPLRQYIFGDINLDQSYQFFASTNEAYNEVWFFYCSANSTVIDRYVIYNHLEKLWSYGNLGRTAWLDTSLRDFPVAAGYGGLLIDHEKGVDDGSTNPPTPLPSYIQSADFNIGDGHNYGFVWRMIPDITFDGSTVNNPQVVFTMRPRQNPGSNYDTAPTPAVISAQDYQAQRNYLVQEFTQIIYTRVRGRQMAFKISSDGLGVQWQLGVPSIDVRPDGRR